MSTKSKAMRLLDNLIGEPMTFGNTLRNIRETDELTQEDVAEKLGVSKSYISMLESGTKVPSVKSAAKYGEALGYGAALFVRLVIQEEIDRAGLDLYVNFDSKRAGAA